MPPCLKLCQQWTTANLFDHLVSAGDQWGGEPQYDRRAAFSLCHPL
jgi:hypothetical protein